MELRYAERFITDLPAKLFETDSEFKLIEDSSPISGRVLNIGERGVEVVLPQIYPFGAKFRIELQLPTQKLTANLVICYSRTDIGLAKASYPHGARMLCESGTLRAVLERLDPGLSSGVLAA